MAELTEEQRKKRLERFVQPASGIVLVSSPTMTQEEVDEWNRKNQERAKADE